MFIVFISNAFNHHQKPLCDALNERLNGNFKFIATAPMSDERKALGWGNIQIPDYVIELNQTGDKVPAEILDMIFRSDVVVLGRCPLFFHRFAVRRKAITFLYSERLYKIGVPWYKLLIHSIRTHLLYGESKNVNLLCASAYTAGDYRKQIAFVNRKYKWGYFPETRRYEDIDSLIKSKREKLGLKRQGVSILWGARLIGLKHPEMPILLAERLKSEGFSFELNMIGNGVMEEELKKMIDKKSLGDCVHLLGSMSPESVRDYMEKSEIFLFTSDRNEGWGAVLNESMNSACAVVANHEIGAVPFLVKDGENGLIYRDGDFDDFYDKVKTLITRPDIMQTMGEKAYQTITNIWNAEQAAINLIDLCEALMGRNQSKILLCGPCSKAGNVS